MRKIEKQMIQAILDRTNWKGANTEVKHSVNSGINYADIYLHSHHIATVTPDTFRYAPFGKANEKTFMEWPTATTRSRLSALGVNASIREGHACIDGIMIV